MDTHLTASSVGEVLTLNGESLDLSVIPDGATLPAAAIDSSWFVGNLYRVGGLLHFTLILPCGPNAPEATLFPAPITVIGDGDIVLPVFDVPPVVDVLPGFDTEAYYAD
jgi:hypothetical protein